MDETKCKELDSNSIIATTFSEVVLMSTYWALPSIVSAESGTRADFEFEEKFENASWLRSNLIVSSIDRPSTLQGAGGQQFENYNPWKAGIQSSWTNGHGVRERSSKYRFGPRSLFSLVVLAITCSTFAPFQSIKSRRGARIRSVELRSPSCYRAYVSSLYRKLDIVGRLWRIARKRVINRPVFTGHSENWAIEATRDSLRHGIRSLNFALRVEIETPHPEHFK